MKTNETTPPDSLQPVVGQKVRIKHDILDPANEDHPTLLRATGGELATLTRKAERDWDWWCVTDSQPKYPMGIKASEFDVLPNDDFRPMADIKDEIAERIWRKVYGDLNQPLMELQTLARHSVQPAHYDRVIQLCDQLNALLARKSPNESSSPTAAGGSGGAERNDGKI